MYEKICENCGKTFFTKRYTARFCCSNCSRKYRRRQADENLLASIVSGHPGEDPFLKDGFVYYRRTCPVCGKSFETIHVDDRYCSGDCAGRGAALSLAAPVSGGPQDTAGGQNIPGIVNTCQNCGKTFISARGHAKFCCEECYLEFRKKNALERKLEAILAENPGTDAFIRDGIIHFRKKCEWCGQAYETIRKSSRFCSENCEDRYRMKQKQENRMRREEERRLLTDDAMKGVQIRMKKTCEWCGREFTAGKSGTRFCSRACAGNHARAEKQKERERSMAPGTVADIASVMTKEYVNINEASLLMRVSRRTVYRLIQDGLLPCCHVNRRSVIRHGDIAEFISKSRRTGSARVPVTESPVHVTNPYFESAGAADYISVSEAAELYGIRLVTMRNYLHKGPLKSIRVGRVKFFLKDDVDRLVRSKKKAMHEEITEWYTVDEIMSRFGMTRRAVYTMVGAHREIPRRKMPHWTCYSKQAVDRICREPEVDLSLYYPARSAAGLLGISLDRLYKTVRRTGVPKVTVRGRIYVKKEEFDELVRLNAPGRGAVN